MERARADAPPSIEPTIRTLGGRRTVAVVALIGAVGWGLAAWEYFVAIPAAANTARVAFALDLVDRFDDTPAHKAYVELAADMKPWWSAIDDLQHRLQAANSDEDRDRLIAERDASLVTFIQDKKIAEKVDLLIGSFDTFTRCLAAAVCDGDIIERSISIDVKRIWRTFRPWVQHRREIDGDRGYGRDLEELYFRFVG